MITFASLLLSLALADNFQTSTIDNKCIIKYHSEDSNLLLDSCLAKEPSSDYYASWLDCCSYCCRVDASGCAELNDESLNQCAYHVQTTQKLSKFVIGVIVGVSFLGLAIASCFLCRILHREPSRKVSHVQNEEEIISRLRWVNTQANLQQTMQTVNELDSQSTCTICLCAQPNMQISCGHWYHLHCFLEWLKKARDCPLCRSASLSNIKIYCSKCFRCFTLLDFSSLLLATDAICKRSRFCDGCEAAHMNGNNESFTNLKKEEFVL